MNTKRNWIEALKQRGRIARGVAFEWRRVACWLAAFAAMFALPYAWSSGLERVEWQGMFFQWAGVMVVAWGLADTRRKLFGKPPLPKQLWDRLRRIGYIIKPPPPIIATMGAVEAADFITNAHGTVRDPITGDLEARVEAMAKNLQRIDEALGLQRQSIEKLEATTKQSVEAERRERTDQDRKISGRLEDAIIGGLHLEFAGVAFLFVGIAFTSIPNRIASLLQVVGL